MVAKVLWDGLFYFSVDQEKVSFYISLRVAKVPPVEELWETVELINYISWLK